MTGAKGVRRAAEPAERKLEKRDIRIGKDVLELLSSSMYVDPMSVYREYVQNAADSIDLAREAGLLGGSEPGQLEISVDYAARSVRLRDNGQGVPSDIFPSRLLSMGGSTKRGSSARGFRGVGRLAGLGYCQELIFRSRASGELFVSELRWDCKKLKSALRAADYSGDLADLIREVVSLRELPPEGFPERFFDVEMRGIIRHRNDRLLNPSAITDYLAQCAPVPFSADLSHGKQISAFLERHGILTPLEIRLSDVDGVVTRPHRNRVDPSVDGSEYSELELFEVPGVDGAIAAVGWVLHHDYVGAISNAALVKGLRVRCGNIQVGDNNLLEDLFSEPRFNSWAVGEVHVLDPRILPNGRRDHFEQSVHFDNLLNYIAPVAREISRRCRTNSIVRRMVRQFELCEKTISEDLAVLRQGALRNAKRKVLLRDINKTLADMEQIARKPSLDAHATDDLQARLKRARQKVQRAIGAGVERSPLENMPPRDRALYHKVFELIYECAANKTAAQSLIDRILAKVA